MTEPKESEEFKAVCEDIVTGILSGEIDDDNLESKKRELCERHSSPAVPKNTDVLDLAPERREELKDVLQRKPTRTASGVSPVAIMTSPKMCPHGKCLYCPGGPASKFSSAQAYTGDEPAAARAEHTGYDPYKQTTLRLEQLREIGHPVDKVHLIIMGGTMTSRSHDYQVWFAKRAIQAMNDYDTSVPPNPSNIDNLAYKEEDEWEYVEDVISKNETSDVRCVGMTFETKPDWCGPEQINRMLRLGGTKVEIGVQTTFDQINRDMHRGHGRDASVSANQRLRDSGFKIGFHMMPGQPGMDREMCIEDFQRIFNKEEWKPDYLKIYPTLVVEQTRVYDMWHRDDFDPLTSEEAAEIVAEGMSEIPRYCRLQRVQRDIPAQNISAGVQKSNLRQLAAQKREEMGLECNCIRCREVGMNEEKPENLEMDVLEYGACGGTEHFISIEDFDKDLIVGFARLRFPDDPIRRELENSALLRELHVYGSEESLGGDGSSYQHRGFGKSLMERAEEISNDAGFDKLTVISGIGARQYYKDKLGYSQDGSYVSKQF